MAQVNLTNDKPMAAPARRFELRMLLVIAGPLIAAYMSELAMGLTTKAIVGRLGYQELGSIGLAYDMVMELSVVLSGILSVVGVLVAQAEGAGRKADAGIAARQGFLIATALGLPTAILIWKLDIVLSWTGQDPQVIAIMGPYVRTMALSILPLMWFFVLRTFVAALAKTGAVMLITIVAVALNYVLCEGLVEGKYGLPELGVAGAGWAKVAVSFFMPVALFVYAYLTPTFRGYGLFKGRLIIDFEVCREIVRLGLPVGGIVILEASLFTAVSIFSGILGAIPLATYQVMLAWVGIAFMFAHGLAEAGMVRVAYGIGRRSVASARQAGILTMTVGVVWLVLLSAVPLNFPEPLVRIFLDPSDDGFQAVLELTTRLLILAAFFQVFDGLQVIATLALRGMKDTIVPMWMATVGYWGFGIMGGWVLAFPLEMGTDGLWWGMAGGLTVTGSLLAVRFLAKTKPAALS